MARSLLALAIVLAVAVAATSVAAGSADTPPALERRGAELYNSGTSAAGPVFATIGESDVRLPAATLPCASCHGADGLGRPEGGLAPVPLTWDHLTKPYGHRHANGREHPAFTETTLKRAVTQGIDPAGNRLDPAMPRFDMRDEELEALLAYLKVLGSDDVPGVTADSITLAMLVPAEGPLAAAGNAAASLVSGFIDEVNAGAGLYGRRLALRTERLPSEPAAAQATLDKLMDESVFALLAAVPPAQQGALAEVSEAAGVPTFHLWPPVPEADPDGQRYSFYLLGGLRQEIEVLIRLAEESLSPDRLPQPVLVVPAQHQGGAAVEVAASLWPDAAAVRAPASAVEARRLAERLKAGGNDVMLALARDQGMAMLVAAAAEIGWSPSVLAPGSLAGAALRGLPAGFDGEVFAAFPMTPADRGEGHLARLAAARPGGDARQPFSEAAGYGTMSLLLEALRSAGRELSRDRLIAAVESLHRFRTGVVPPVTFGPNRRIGAELRIVQGNRAGRRGLSGQ